MSEKTLNTRIIHKHDTEINWSKATNFIPKKGEIIIYDKDNNYNYERIKVGDGTTLVNNLPFYGSSIENILDGIASGSVRTSSSTTESTDYKLGTAAFAEGKDTKAKGNYSHAEGQDTTASGDHSHAEGYGTTASSDHQHVQGQYNIEDSSNTYADIIGKGIDTYNRSNISTVDWSGNAWYAGDVYVGSTSGKNKDEGSKKLATEEYVNTSIAGIVNSAPETLNTLNELAGALGDDPNFATTVATQIGNKVDKIEGKGLSTNDYTTAEKNKLAGIAEGANNYTHPDTHPATMITEDSTHRFVTDDEKTTWNNKANTDLTNIDNATFKSKVEASGFSSGAKVQIVTWEEND